jgi:hypothetical protein
MFFAGLSSTKNLAVAPLPLPIVAPTVSMPQGETPVLGRFVAPGMLRADRHVAELQARQHLAQRVHRHAEPPADPLAQVDPPSADRPILRQVGL